MTAWHGEINVAVERRMDPFGWSETGHVPAAERAGGEEQQAAADVRRQGAREVWERRRCLAPPRPPTGAATMLSDTCSPGARAAVPAPPLVAQRIQQEGSSVRTGNLVKMAKAGWLGAWEQD